MEIAQAQADARRIYSGGWGGPAVSSVIWLAAALTADRAGVETGAAVLFWAGAVLIFPVNTLLNKLLSGEADLPSGHPMRGLAMQTAGAMSVVLLALWMVAPLAPAAFFPLAMVAVGAHYLPFTHLYGEPLFLGVGVVQCGAGLVLLVSDTGDSVGGYAMAGLLALTAVVLAVRHRQLAPA